MRDELAEQCRHAAPDSARVVHPPTRISNELRVIRPQRLQKYLLELTFYFPKDLLFRWIFDRQRLGPIGACKPLKENESFRFGQLQYDFIVAHGEAPFRIHVVSFRTASSCSPFNRQPITWFAAFLASTFKSAYRRVITVPVITLRAGVSLP